MISWPLTPPTGRAAHRLIHRLSQRPTPLRRTVKRGITFDADPALEASGQICGLPQGGIRLTTACAGAGAWCALHLALGRVPLRGVSALTITCRSSAPAIDVMRPCLRSGIDGGFVDCMFPKHVLASPDQRHHSDQICADHAATLPYMADWRELVLFFPTHSFEWTLHDLRLGLQ